MRPIRLTLAILLLVAMQPPTHAAEGGQHNRYKWRDAQGNLHFDDALPVEALQFGYDVVDGRGLTIKHVDRAKTPEELKAEEQAAERRAEEKRAAEEQAKADQQTLAAYPTENELINSQQAQLQMLEQNIAATQASLQSQEKSLTEMLSHAADLDRNGKPVPTTLQSQIDALRRNIEQQKNYIVGKQKEKEDSEKKFAVDLAHYRELRARTGTR